MDLDHSKTLNCHIARRFPQKYIYMTPTSPLKQSENGGKRFVMMTKWQSVDEKKIRSGARVKRRFEAIKKDNPGCVNIRRVPIGVAFSK